MTLEQWKIALIGALGGATISLVIVFGAFSLGLFTDRAAMTQTVHDAIMAKPEILLEAQNALNDKQAQDEVDATQKAVASVGNGYFDPRVAFVTGPANAKKTVVEFFDYNCPYCRVSLPAVKKFYDQHKNDTRFAFIEFPIKGENSVLATRATLAARKQPGKYLAFHFALMSEENLIDAALIDATATKIGLNLAQLHKDMDDPELAQTIARAHLLAQRSKINGTPTFIVNGNVRPGAVNDELIAQLYAKAPPARR